MRLSASGLFEVFYLHQFLSRQRGYEHILSNDHHSCIMGSLIRPSPLHLLAPLRQIGSSRASCKKPLILSKPGKHSIEQGAD